MPNTMNAVYRIVVLVFYICGSYSIKYDSREEQLKCIKACRDTKNRFCHQPPDVCGDCLNSFEERRGTCEPTKVLDIQNYPDASAALPDEQHPENQLGGKTHVSDGKIVSVLKKDQREVNYASANVESNSTDVQQQPADSSITNDIVFIAVIASVSAAALIGIIIAVVCWCTLKKSAKESSDYEYPGYGTMEYKGPAKGTGDRRLAQSAQMYHYQHRKQQMLEMEKNQSAISRSGSDISSDEDNDANEYTVYECPGLATAGEMEVPNPLFSEPPEASATPDAPQESAENHSSQIVNGYKES